MKENRAFTSFYKLYFFYKQKKNNQKNRQDLHEIFWNPSTSVQRCLNLLFQRTLFLLPPLFRGYLNLQVRINKIVKQCWLPPLSFKISLKDKSFHIFVNSLGCISLQNACWIFSQTCIFHHVWGKFSDLWCSRS